MELQPLIERNLQEKVQRYQLTMMSQQEATTIARRINEYIILSPVVRIKARNEYEATFRAFRVGVPVLSSPSNAPRKGIMSTPHTPVKNATTKPIVAPLVAALLPPVFFVNQTGAIKSTMVTTTAITPHPTNDVNVISHPEQK